ncbi:MAG: HPr kinase/phosphatase C-terminal domain-containing protein [Rhodobacteraceae bacterium]|nr:HPr kinase/phosphatase C-terminal domain-containing protein [Paracoccaceae bacterium]
MAAPETVLGSGPDNGPDTGPLTLHATTVAFDGQGVLIRGASGAGKSALGLQLMALGAVLVADDQTVLHRQGDQLIATCPPGLTGLIEARGIGLLNAPWVAQAVLRLVVDLDRLEAARLPDWHQTGLLGRSLSLVLRSESAHFPAAIRHYVLYGRRG